MDAIAARRTLDRLKRGVPPTSLIDKLSVGLTDLERELDSLLESTAQPRWFFVQSEYGEGKSHFHSYAKERALRAGYAVASLDVNNDNGALNQPQRHLALVLESIRSPLPGFRYHQGVASLFRHWLETAGHAELVRILEKLRKIEPWVWAGRDPTRLHELLGHFADDGSLDNPKLCYFQDLISYISTEDLTSKSAYARFAASYRLQVVLEWLVDIGHRGLLLFIDEVDNVVRQIRPTGHPGCFRTLAWYCSCPAFPRLRTVFASTPEIVEMLNSSRRNYYLKKLRDQVTVTNKEVRVYERWSDETDGLSNQGWQTCPKLTRKQRKLLFGLIADLHQGAWGWSCEDLNGTVEKLLSQPQLRTTRSWVRASVQLLDLVHQSDSGSHIRISSLKTDL